MTQFTRRLVLGMPLASLAADGGVDSGYPMQSPDVVKEMVTVEAP